VNHLLSFIPLPSLPITPESKGGMDTQGVRGRVGADAYRENRPGLTPNRQSYPLQSPLQSAGGSLSRVVDVRLIFFDFSWAGQGQGK
jgi:hypothetical protein